MIQKQIKAKQKQFVTLVHNVSARTRAFTVTSDLRNQPCRLKISCTLLDPVYDAWVKPKRMQSCWWDFQYFLCMQRKMFSSVGWVYLWCWHEWEWAVAGWEGRIFACVKKQSWCLERPPLHLSCCLHLCLSLTLVGTAAAPPALVSATATVGDGFVWDGAAAHTSVNVISFLSLTFTLPFCLSIFISLLFHIRLCSVCNDTRPDDSLINSHGCCYKHCSSQRHTNTTTDRRLFMLSSVIADAEHVRPSASNTPLV